MGLQDKGSAPSPASDVLNLPGRLPGIPDVVIDRFPEMEGYDKKMDKWWRRVIAILSEGTQETSTVINVTSEGLIDISLTVDGNTASILEEAKIRAEADGYLEGKYTLTVTAGNVVTGMNITSATGPGVNISEVVFQADKFQIYSGAADKVMFVADAINDVVRLADTLVVDAGNQKVYIGAGNYANADTAWFVNDAGRMSLKDKLTWDGTTLTIVGSITATTGTIGGFTIGANYLRDTANSFGLASTITGGDDIRFWAGATFANRATAPLRITEAGLITATSGTIGGFTLTSTKLSAGAGASLIELTATGAPGMKIGGTSTTPGYAGSTAVGFAVEAGSNALFVSRAANFSGSFNRNNDGAEVLFHRSGTQVGSVSVTTTTTAFNTTSDKRLKQKILKAGKQGAVVDGIQVREYEFKRDKGRRHLGFIAQELHLIYPDAVSVGTDDEPWMIDYSKLVPVLLSELQDQRARLKVLEP